MAATKRPALEKITTPTGVLVFPKLNAPDTGPWVGAKPIYQARIKLSAEESAPLIARFEAAVKVLANSTKAALTQAMNDATDPKEKVKAKEKRKALKLMTDLCYKAAVDDQGDETGEFVFSFKMNSTYTDAKGVIKSLSPDLFDAKGKPFDRAVDIWGGSTAKVAGELNPFVSPKMEVGMSLRLKAVQIIQLRTSGGRNADAFGFGQEDGYEAPEQATFPTDSTEAAGAPDSTDNDDF